MKIFQTTTVLFQYFDTASMKPREISLEAFNDWFNRLVPIAIDTNLYTTNRNIAEMYTCILRYSIENVNRVS